MRSQLENQKKMKLNVWSENGHIFCLEEGDLKPFDMQTHVDEHNASEYLAQEFESLTEAGYEIIIGKPDILSEKWIIEGEVVHDD